MRPDLVIFNNMEKILIVDNEEDLIHFLRRFFSKMGYQVSACADGSSALDTLAKEQFDLILIDYKMPGLNGLDTLKEIKKLQVKTPIVIMTAFGTMETAIEAMNLVAYDYILKPFDREELSRVATDALQGNRLMKEVVSFPDEVNKASLPSKVIVRIVGSHRKMQEVYKLIGQIASKAVTVLITGESGTGKELAARAIYHHSARKNKPFLTVNCPAIPDALFESELFGYEQGAFTGAERAHLGKFERSNGGTLFFDEIGDMSLFTQAKVLRVLQEGEIDRLGGDETIKVDVRIITATNKNLKKEVSEGRFREDLYWRLKIISLHLPSLKDRLEDVPALVDYFLARFNEEYNKSIQYVDEAAIHKLTSYPWPGNVRELENCIRRAVLLNPGTVILDDHIDLEPDQESSFKKPVAFIDRSNQEELLYGYEKIIQNLEDKLDAIAPSLLRFSQKRGSGQVNILELIEKLFISRALRECGYNQVKAAKMLGISRNTLRHRIQKYSLESPGNENEVPGNNC